MLTKRRKGWNKMIYNQSTISIPDENIILPVIIESVDWRNALTGLPSSSKSGG